MKKLYKLFAIELVQNFTVTYFAFFTVAFTIDFFERIDTILSLKLNVYQTVLFFLMRTPFIHTQIALYSLIISCMITLNILSQKNEIVALLSSGVETKRIFVVIFGFVAIVNVFNFINDSYLTPKYLLKSDAHFGQSNAKILGNISDIILKTDDGFIFIDLIIPKENTLLNTYIVKVDKTGNKLQDIHHAPVVRFENGTWVAKGGKKFVMNEKRVINETEFKLPEIRLLKDIGSINYKPEWLSLKDVFRIIKSGKRSGMDVTAYYYQFAKKLMRFFSPFLLFFCVFPLGFQLGRNKKNVEIIFIGIIILLGYSVAETFIYRISQSSGTNPLTPTALLILPLLTAGRVIWKRHFFWKTV